MSTTIPQFDQLKHLRDTLDKIFGPNYSLKNPKTILALYKTLKFTHPNNIIEIMTTVKESTDLLMRSNGYSKSNPYIYTELVRIYAEDQ